MTDNPPEQWRVIEGVADGTSLMPHRVVGGVGRETRPVASFMHLTDAENTAADHNAAAKLQQALEALREQGETVHLVLSGYKRFAVHQGHTFDSCPVRICADARAALSSIGGT